MIAKSLSVSTGAALCRPGLHLTSITRTNKSTSNPRLGFYAPWLGEMGFVPDALVQFLPEPGGMTFSLCNENIVKYSTLLRNTKESGGTLLHVNLHRHRPEPMLCLSGAALDGTGLTFGDSLLIRYEPGFIRMRKLPGDGVKLVCPHVSGPWLSEAGFLPDAVFTMDCEPGLVTCTLWENDINRIRQRTAELVRHARLHKLKLLQVQKWKYKRGLCQFFDIPHSCLKVAGFSKEEPLLALYSYGLIKLQKPDFVGLGF